MSEIMLAKSYDEKKLEFPVEITTKLDGVAADFYKTPDGWLCQSRQGKPLPSTGYIIAFLNKYAADVEVNTHIIGELTVVGVDSFREAGGIIRRQEPDKRIVLNAYDLYVETKDNAPYSQRKTLLVDIVNLLTKPSLRASMGNVEYFLVATVPRVAMATNKNDLLQHFKALPDIMQQSALFEGFMVRNWRGKHSMYGVGKRSFGMMKYKPKPTVDLRVHSFEEATANKDMNFLGESYSKGEGLNAVGRINCEYHTGASSDGKNEFTDFQIIGVGPGCLTHEQRRALWFERDKIENLIIEVEYMQDDNYDALRQPVFKRFRFDKDEPSQEA